MTRPIVRLRGRCRLAKYRIFGEPADFDAHFRSQRRLGFPEVLDRAERRLGYRPNLSAPRTFNEKTIHRQLFSRDPIWIAVSDKVELRSWIKQNGYAGLVDFFPVHSIIEPGQPLDLGRLPSSFALKAAWASGLNIFQRSGRYTPAEICETVERWREQPYGVRKLVWAAQWMPRRCVVEELVLDEKANPPKDYRFFMFHGKLRMLSVDTWADGIKSIALFGPNLEPLEVINNRARPSVMPRLPANVEDMLRVAERLSERFDMIRVDLYDHEGRIVLGELTMSHAGGGSWFKPAEFDRQLGDFWRYDAKAAERSCDIVPEARTTNAMRFGRGHYDRREFR